MPDFDQTLAVYKTFDLFTWQQQGTLELSPKFQRRSVWKSAARAYLIDTMLRSFPVPAIHLRITVNPSTHMVVREVIDGQQRLKSVFDFLENKFRLNKNTDAAWAGKLFSELSEDLRQRLTMYGFHAYQYEGLNDEQALEIFARINTYSVAMNAQELRNGKYFGEFKSTVYALGIEYLQLWRKLKIFTESGIARMGEAEFVSELLILQMDGLQDKKTSIDDFYSNLDDSWPAEPAPWQTRSVSRPKQWLSAEESRRRFRIVMTEIDEAAGDVVRQSAFRRVPLFYSLYASVYHRVFGLPNFAYSTPRRRLTADRKRDLSAALIALSETLQEASEAELERVPNYQREFVLASSQQTDNLLPRRRRLESIWRQARLGTDE